MKLNRKPVVRYSWDEWFSLAKSSAGGITLSQGEDFECQVHSMNVQIRHAAFLRGLRVSVHIRDDRFMDVRILHKDRKKGKRLNA